MVRNPIENLSYFLKLWMVQIKNLMNVEKQKNNYTRDILHIDRNTFNKSIEEIILYILIQIFILNLIIGLKNFLKLLV